MIRLVPKRVLTYRNHSWWFRVGDTAKPTIQSNEDRYSMFYKDDDEPEYYDDSAIEVIIHRSEKGVLVGHQVRVKVNPPVPMLCDNYTATIIYTRNFYSAISIVFVNHFFRLLSVGVYDKNYMIVVRNGRVDIPTNDVAIRSVESMLTQGVYDYVTKR